jgi:soluble lytic murein transglycosylase-like protein
MYSTIILATAKSVGVPGALLLAICTHESNLVNIMVPNDGGDASYGICQIKEDTAREMGYRGISSGPLKLTDNPVFTGDMEPDGPPAGLMIPKVNARYAAKYLKKWLNKYDGDWCKAVAAYNWGSYSPSKKYPGKPKNFKYVKKVILHLDEKNKDFLVCGPRKVENE